MGGSGHGIVLDVLRRLSQFRRRWSVRGPRDGARRGKIDDREVLAPDDFAVFVRLRQLRKEIAQSECW